MRQQPVPTAEELQDIDDLLELARRLDVTINVSGNVDILGEPVEIDGRTAPNSLAVQAMEGCDGDSEGRPRELTFRRYRRFAGGGAGLLWSEAIAVTPEARANPRQLRLTEKTRDDFARLMDTIRETARQKMGEDHRPVVIAQLTHSGRYSKPQGEPAPLIPQHDPHRDARMDLDPDHPVLTDEYLDQLVEKYVRAARLAFDVGFDGVDIKSCHGYLINEMFGCRRREGKYGGSFENRTRFLLDVVEAIHDELGKDKLVTTRMGIYDATPYPYSWGVSPEDPGKPDLTEPKRLVGELVDRGVSLLNVSMGNPYYNPHVNRPFDRPVEGGYESPEHPLEGVARLISLAGEVQQAYPRLAVVGSGYSWLRDLLPYVAAGTRNEGLATFIGCGRMAFAYPDFARDLLERGEMDREKVCISCSACTQIMRDGGRTGCVVRDSDVYGPIYRRGRLANREYLEKLAEACRGCHRPSCRQGCPANMDIPAFIGLFLEREDAEAYEVMRRTNVFPELCALLCPTEELCEGHCYKEFLDEQVPPIAEVQRFLAQEANRRGWAQLRVPEERTGKEIAVLGGGPCGLACAARLMERGHAVTVFDQDSDLGGMISSVIPSDRHGSGLSREKSVIFGDVPSDLLSVETEHALSEDYNLNNILEQGYDAAFIATGLPEPVTVQEHPEHGVWDGLAFLRTAKDNGLDLTGQEVVVVGGGNTAMDVAVSARRCGAKDVYMLYRRSFDQMPAWASERDRALEEGVHIMVLSQPLEYLEEEGELKGVKVCPTRLGEPDESDRRSPEPQPGSSYVLDVDVAVEAVGQTLPANMDAMLPGVKIEDGLVRVKSGTLETYRAGVFAGGDIVRGPSTVVAAVSDGMRAAGEIDEYVRHSQEEKKGGGGPV